MFLAMNTGRSPEPVVITTRPVQPRRPRPEDRILFPFSFGPFIGFWAGFDAATRLGALTVLGGGQDSVLRLRTLIEASAAVLVCTPSYALRLAQVAREQGIDPATTSIRVTIHAGPMNRSMSGSETNAHA